MIYFFGDSGVLICSPILVRLCEYTAERKSRAQSNGEMYYYIVSYTVEEILTKRSQSKPLWNLQATVLAGKDQTATLSTNYLRQYSSNYSSSARKIKLHYNDNRFWNLQSFFIFWNHWDCFSCKSAEVPPPQLSPWSDTKPGWLLDHGLWFR